MLNFYIILMNPFNQVQNNIQETYSIKLWKEKKGRRTDTYLTGWLKSKDDLLIHHKKLKRSLGCNGTVKYKKKDDESILFFHLQGDRVNDITNYLKELGINENNIDIIG